MKHIRNKLDNLLYAYNPDEFFPIWEDGQLLNRNEFIAYKAGRFARKAGHAFIRFSDAFDRISDATN